MPKQLPTALDLSGRRVLVTGAASGIGRATAQALAELGADLTLCDRQPLAETRALAESAGAHCMEAHGDLADAPFMASLFAGGRVHALAHCAAILDGRPWREDAAFRERFHRVMDVNVRVPLELATVAIDHMAEHGGGNVVLVGSVAGRSGGTSPNTPPDYAASKGAVHTLIRLLSRNAVARGVLVNGVAPGPVETAMTQGMDLGPQVPLRRMARPAELAWPIAFLCSPAASYLSGALIDVNGGSFVG